MSRLFEQAGSMNFQCAATSGGLTREFRLNLRPDVNGDCHGPPPKLYGTAALRSSQTWAIPQRGADRATANCSIIDTLKCGSARCSCCSRSEEHTSELQSLTNLVCRLLLEKKQITT